MDYVPPGRVAGKRAGSGVEKSGIVRARHAHSRFPRWGHPGVCHVPRFCGDRARSSADRRRDSLKMGVVGCPRNCAEATVKDIGLVGQEGSWQVVVGGAAGKKVRKADLLVTVESAEEALQVAALFFQHYRENANYLERTYDFVERLESSACAARPFMLPLPCSKACALA
jgi:Nitrite and sulphite reductase 4Fe-4S domain